MTPARSLLEEALQAGLLLETDGKLVHWCSPLGGELPEGLLSRLARHKAELVALLARRAHARRLVCRAFAQLLEGQAPTPLLSTASNAEADAAVTDAFWQAVEEGDFIALRRALDEYVGSLKQAVGSLSAEKQGLGCAA
jgi:hypothetical protein